MWDVVHFHSLWETWNSGPLQIVCLHTYYFECIDVFPSTILSSQNTHNQTNNQQRTVNQRSVKGQKAVKRTEQQSKLSIDLIPPYYPSVTSDNCRNPQNVRKSAGTPKLLIGTVLWVSRFCSYLTNQSFPLLPSPGPALWCSNCLPLSNWKSCIHFRGKEDKKFFASGHKLIGSEFNFTEPARPWGSPV